MSGFPDQALFYLVIGISIIIGFVFAFSGFAIFFRVKNHQKARKWAALEGVWEPLMMEVLYGGAPPESLWERVQPKDERYFVDFLLRYVRRLSGDERRLLRRLAAPYLSVIAGHVNRRGAERRARAIQTLGELGMPEYADQLVHALDDPAILVAMTAARGLARPEHPEYTAAVMDRLHRFTHWRGNFLAAMLSAMGPDAAPAIRQTFADRKRDPNVRSVAAVALRQLNDARSAETAAEIARTDDDREVVAASLRLLGRVGRPEDLSLVRARLGAKDAVVRGAAASALGRLGSQIDVSPLYQIAMEDGSRWVAISAARSLRDLGGHKTLRDLAASGHGRASLALQVLSEVGG